MSISQEIIISCVNCGKEMEAAIDYSSAKGIYLRADSCLKPECIEAQRIREKLRGN